MTIRYFWNPRCHIIYKQYCVIYLVRLKYPFLATIDDIECLARSACLSGYRIYALYGPEDFIVISWAQMQKHDEFHNKCEENSRFRAVHRFDCEQSFPNHRLSDIVDTTAIDDFYDCSRDGVDLDLRNAHERILVEGGMRVPIPTRGMFRFFTHFQLPSNPSDDARLAKDQQFIVEIFKEFCNQNRGSHVCVYIRKVDGKPKEFLVEILSDNYDSYYEELGRLKAVWTREKINSVTYVVSSPKVVEIDEIDTNWNVNALGSRESRLLKFLQHPEAFRAFAECSDEGRRKLVSYFTTFALENNNPFNSTLRSLLLAFLLEDREYLIRALTLTVKRPYSF